MNDPAANFDPRYDSRDDAPAPRVCACCGGLETLLPLRGGACADCWLDCVEGRPCAHQVAS
jgi:hypothetical protein